MGKRKSGSAELERRRKEHVTALEEAARKHAASAKRMENFPGPDPRLGEAAAAVAQAVSAAPDLAQAPAERAKTLEEVRENFERVFGPDGNKAAPKTAESAAAARIGSLDPAAMANDPKLTGALKAILEPRLPRLVRVIPVTWDVAVKEAEQALRFALPPQEVETILKVLQEGPPSRWKFREMGLIGGRPGRSPAWTELTITVPPLSYSHMKPDLDIYAERVESGVVYGPDSGLKTTRRLIGTYKGSEGVDP